MNMGRAFMKGGIDIITLYTNHANKWVNLMPHATKYQPFQGADLTLRLASRRAVET